MEVLQIMPFDAVSGRYSWKKVIRPACTETTALGAAYLAGLSCGVYSDKDEIKKNMSIDRQFEPQMDDKIKMKNLPGGDVL